MAAQARRCESGRPSIQAQFRPPRIIGGFGAVPSSSEQPLGPQVLVDVGSLRHAARDISNNLISRVKITVESVRFRSLPLAFPPPEDPGGVPERLNGPVSKTGVGHWSYRGSESHPLRSCGMRAIAVIWRRSCSPAAERRRTPSRRASRRPIGTLPATSRSAPATGGSTSSGSGRRRAARRGLEWAARPWAPARATWRGRSAELQRAGIDPLEADAALAVTSNYPFTCGSTALDPAGVERTLRAAGRARGREGGWTTSTSGEESSIPSNGRRGLRLARGARATRGDRSSSTRREPRAVGPDRRRRPGHRGGPGRGRRGLPRRPGRRAVHAEQPHPRPRGRARTSSPSASFRRPSEPGARGLLRHRRRPALGRCRGGRAREDLRARRARRRHGRSDPRPVRRSPRSRSSRATA